MPPYNVSCSRDNHPSGHSKCKPLPCYDTHPMDFPSQDNQLNYCTMPQFKDFTGPYKNCKPLGNRTPGVGEKIWGDVPYLPSYLDPMYTKGEPEIPKDNLYFRGPFYKGVSETHTEFVNRGVAATRQYHEYKRHYEEPGMKYDRSVTQADFQPPLPMLPRDKTPCLEEDPEKPWYKPERKEPKNPHAKEHEVRSRQPEVVFVDEEEDCDRNFGTEHTDNYICYQGAKTGTKIRDPLPVPDEIFLRNMRGRHQSCNHPLLSSDLCDGSCKTRKHCPDATSKETSWLLHPRNYSFQNGVMLLPCKCRNADTGF